MQEVIAPADNLEVHEVPDGYIVYQTARDRVHYLNKTAAVIFEFCDGRRDRTDIISRVAMAFELPPHTHEEVATCLDSLMREGLLRSISK
ncbi:MAG: PqqD family protein [Bradyrhizobium sp.]|uniref:PqqD family protein n=1 Tax=Bradyrhizobium sp. TaxID=376 RepID=UPI0012181A26|nr:PqqD family protein [Bradyrhizobium sp.]THD66228.1 MAG: PqqD family protein [Bradyrhizobium sp.]